MIKNGDICILMGVVMRLHGFTVIAEARLSKGRCDENEGGMMRITG